METKGIEPSTPWLQTRWLCVTKRCPAMFCDDDDFALHQRLHHISKSDRPAGCTTFPKATVPPAATRAIRARFAPGRDIHDRPAEPSADHRHANKRRGILDDPRQAAHAARQAAFAGWSTGKTVRRRERP